LKADYDWHPYAQIHVVLNPRESGIIWNSHYIPHWRQPGLIPRNPLRGDAFENIAYFGEIDNLAPELRDAKWSDRLKAMGLKWCVMPRERWHDFSEVDAIVAVRSFQHRGYLAKPATKLYNAWHAGVPALLGEEAAYQAERKSDLDYCRVSSVEMTLNCLAKLMADIKLRNAMVENGRARALETASELTVEKWKHLINQIVIPAYLKWSGEAAPRREMFLRYRLIASKIRSWKMTLRRLLKPA
jgi:hypothetical protein